MPASPLNVAVVTASASRLAGGLFTSVRRSSQSVSDDGHAVSVLAIEDVHSAEDLKAWGTLSPTTHRSAGPGALGLAPAMSRSLDSGNFDLIHQHGIWLALSTQVSAWRRKTGKPVIISPRGMLDPWAVQNAGWKKRLAGWAYENDNLHGATCLHALNQSEADSMRAYGLLNPIAIIPNGTDMPDRSQDLPRPDWLTADGRKTLLFLGRLHPKKGLFELVEAWRRLRDNAPDVTRQWRLVLAGWDDGGHVPALQSLIDQAGFSEDDIILPGPLHGADKDTAFAAADAFILPSHSEGLPMAVLEAWSWNLPVLMTEACNLPEGFAAGAAIRITPEPAALSEALETSLQRQNLATLGSAGRELVKDRFTWESIGDDLVSVYGWMRDGGAAPPCVQFA